mgnify:CR=1 FL=1
MRLPGRGQEVRGAKGGHARHLQIRDAPPRPPGAGHRGPPLGHSVRRAPVPIPIPVCLRPAKRRHPLRRPPHGPPGRRKGRSANPRDGQAGRVRLQRGRRQQALLHLQVQVDHIHPDPPGTQIPGQGQEPRRGLAGLGVGGLDEEDGAHRPGHGAPSDPARVIHVASDTATSAKVGGRATVTTEASRGAVKPPGATQEKADQGEGGVVGFRVMAGLWPRDVRGVKRAFGAPCRRPPRAEPGRFVPPRPVASPAAGPQRWSHATHGGRVAKRPDVARADFVLEARR